MNIRASRTIFSAALCAVLSIAAQAGPISVIPTDDGSVTPLLISTSDYVIAGDDFLFGRGVIEFSTAEFRGHVQSASLAVNPYGLPLFAPVMNVFGYESTNGLVDLDDYSRGTFLGQWALPALNYREEAFFDVSAFLASVNSSFVGFVLQGLPNPDVPGGGYNVFSSLEFNYGTPSRLLVTVPEPATSGLLAFGAALVLVSTRRRRRPSHVMHA